MSIDNTSIAHAETGIQASLALQIDLESQINSAQRSTDPGKNSKVMMLKSEASQVASQLTQHIKNKANAERDLQVASQAEQAKASESKLKQESLKHLDPASHYATEVKAKPEARTEQLAEHDEAKTLTTTEQAKKAH